MLTPITKITFQQVPTFLNPDRKRGFTFPFCHSWKAENSWGNLCDKAEITLPKKVYVRDENRKATALGGTNINLGGFDGQSPLFLRGDKVKIEAGYKIFDKRGNETTPTATIFEGFISEVSSKSPFVISLKDNMYLLQTTNAPLRTYTGFTVEAMLQDMITRAGLPLTVNMTTSTTLGTYYSNSDRTICQVLDDLRKTYHFRAYFKGSELRCGSFVYLPEDVAGKKSQVFQFQKNIISDDLTYRRLDDVVLSAVAHNTVTQVAPGLTKTGGPKSKQVRLEVLVTLSAKGVTSYVKKANTDSYPENTNGDRRELYFSGAQTIDQLVTLATNELKTYYYAGLHGKFTTFGMPFVNHGDTIEIRDLKLPERNGFYKIKGVETSGGVSGYRQEIELDYRINVN